MFGCHGGYGVYMLGMGIWGVIIFIVFWGLVVAGVVALWQYFSRSQKKEKTPREILEERFARGEITKEEFEIMKKVLEK